MPLQKNDSESVALLAIEDRCLTNVDLPAPGFPKITSLKRSPTNHWRIT